MLLLFANAFSAYATAAALINQGGIDPAAADQQRAHQRGRLCHEPASPRRWRSA